MSILITILVIVSGLVLLNVLLLIFSSNDCGQDKKLSKPKYNMPEKNNIINQPVMADK